MKFALTAVIAYVFMFLFASFHPKDEWTNLLDKDLSQWRIYQGYRHKLGYKGDVPIDENGKTIAPIGYDKNINNVFSVQDENGTPVLRISGEIYGCVFTKKEFANYHLKLKVKWGTKKWNPRLDEPMDSGICYNSIGECGVDYWRAWMLSQEFQIMEKSCGDYWNIADSRVDVKAVLRPDTAIYVYNKDGKKISMGIGTDIKGYCQRSQDYENPKGEWNTLELICFGDKSLHIVNGHIVMALSNSRYTTGNTSKPLIKGKIQLQSEAAEVFYKEIQIRQIDRIPAEYALRD